MPSLTQLVDDVAANRFELNDGQLLIGRHPDCDVQINDIAVSSRHALIEVVPNPHLQGLVDVYISDQGSTNGTLVNDLPVNNRQRLNNNDVVRVAWNTFQFIEEAGNTLEKTAYTLE